jgi:hypothetical protein
MLNALFSIRNPNTSAHVSPYHESGWVEPTPVDYSMSQLTGTLSGDTFHHIQKVAISG